MKDLTKKHIITKVLWQVVLYFIEIFGISFLITYLTTYISSISSYLTLIERMVMSYTIYQILVVIILTNLNDIKEDSYLALLKNLKYCLLYIEYKRPEIKAIIFKNIEYQLDSGTLNNLEVRSEYKYLKENLNSLERWVIEAKIVEVESSCESVSLKWRFSFLLRLFK